MKYTDYSIGLDIWYDEKRALKEIITWLYNELKKSTVLKVIMSQILQLRIKRWKL